MSRIAGVDVSHYQGTGINWTSVKNAGYTFAWAKATEGLTYNDDTFTTNMANARGKVLIGPYHFARYDNQKGTSGASSEENHFWNTIKGYYSAFNAGAYMTPMLDLENAGGGTPGTAGYSKTTFSQWALQFLNDLKADLQSVGFNLTPVVYTGASFAGSWLDGTISQSFPLWMANYNGQNRDTGSPFTGGYGSPWKTPGGWQFWQYTSSQSVSGIGSGDADVFSGDIYDLKSDYVLGGAPRWNMNARVVMNTTETAWATSSATAFGTSVASGVHGTVINSTAVYGNSFWRWQIHFDNGVTGWVGEDFLDSAAPSAATSPDPGNNVVTNSLPASFSWTAGANASSYNVYLDNVLKSNVTGNAWTHPSISDGAHTWRVDSLNAELLKTGTTWDFTVDTVAPAASYGAQAPAAGATTLDFTVTYNDATSGLNAGAFDGNDVTVTGPANYTANASFVSASPGGNGSPRTVTYRIAAPGGSWNLADNGTYTVSQNANQVTDVAGNSVAAGAIGSFNLNIPFAWQNGSTLNVEYDTSGQPISLGTSGANVTATKNETSLIFSGISSIVVTGTSGADALDFDGPIAPTVALNLGSGADVLNVNSGLFTFDADASAGTAALSINDYGAIAFNSTQHLAALNLLGGVATLAAGHDKVIVLDTITASDAGRLDLRDNDLIANAMSPVAFAALLDSGYASDAWNGTGIVSSPAPENHATIGYGQAWQIFNSFPAVLDGETITDPNAMIARWTIQGDSNLDNVVSTSDFIALAQHFSAASPDFTSGDFNYDGVVNALDFNALATMYGGSASPAASTTLALAAAPAASLFSTTSIDRRTIGLIDSL